MRDRWFIHQIGLWASDATMMGFSIYNFPAEKHNKGNIPGHKHGWAPLASKTKCERGTTN